jgi:hypothetical protein
MSGGDKCGRKSPILAENRQGLRLPAVTGRSSNLASEFEESGPAAASFLKYYFHGLPSLKFRSKLWKIK